MMDDTRMDLNLLDVSGDGTQSTSITIVNQSEIQQVVHVDSVDESANLNKKPDEPMAGPSSQAHGSGSQLTPKKSKYSN